MKPSNTSDMRQNFSVRDVKILIRARRNLQKSIMDIAINNKENTVKK